MQIKDRTHSASATRTTTPDASLTAVMSKLRTTQHLNRRLTHALNNLNTTPHRNDIRTSIELYLDTCQRIIATDSIGEALYVAAISHSEWTRLLGLATPYRYDHDLPVIAQAILDALDAPVDALEETATTTGQPQAVAFLHLLGATQPRTRRLVATGVKRGRGPLTVTEVAA